jgi:hypothetical protein
VRVPTLIVAKHGSRAYRVGGRAQARLNGAGA